MGSNDTDVPLADAGVLRRLAPVAGLGELWLRLADGDDDAQADAVDAVTDRRVSAG